MPTALITGAGRGIGFATAAAFAKAGWTVLGLDREFSDFPHGQKIQYDLQNLEGIPNLIASLGELDTLVNNAGVLHCDPFGEIPEKHKREILAVNLEAPVALIEALSPQMKRKKSGRIVNLASVAAFTGHPDLWYGITKAGVLNLTKAWARELGPHGVLVNAVAPGPTQTAMYEQLPQSRKDGVMRSVYSGRVCMPAEVAGAILWLGSACPAYVNGTTLDVNDGSYPR
ncbi:MAG TPA: SDR family oxidoreductase [Burkholderiales bacterium]|jgi:3-oxoacyl-[acyl-carrier protein] reductase|nr:SDR family oxidoreductase [Burkholderiales bacterium]HEX2648303.1 SDR family oxidoreductase [Burkholderiales bacterium]